MSNKNSLRKAWFTLFVLRSFSQRKGRILVAAAAMMLTAAVITTFLMLSVGINEKLDGALRGYGANVLVFPDSHRQETLPPDALDRVRSLHGVVDHAVAQVYGRAAMGSLNVEITGTALDPVGTGSPRVDGAFPSDPAHALVGAQIAAAAGITKGSRITLTTRSRSEAFLVVGISRQGNEQDRSVVIDVDRARKLLGLEEGFSAILVGVHGPSDAAIAALKAVLPDARVKSLREVNFGAENLLNTIQLLIVLVTLVVFASSIVTVGSTMTATAIEREVELGLMRALGAPMKTITALFAAETAFIGLVGGLIGAFAGIAIAQFVSRSAFDAFLEVPLWPLGVIVPLAVGIAVGSGHNVVRKVVKRPIAHILREG